mmetsp:Transcript_16459/g.35504  ORF Transcript_16459/g.35504 Transcript_16459/m.35504 type:complete len:357 (+) Transcript_16459:140-1210(+)
MGCGTGKQYKASETSQDSATTAPEGKAAAAAVGSDKMTDAERAEEDAKLKAQQGRARRQGVAAESVNQDRLKDYKKPVYPKDQSSVDHIVKTLKENDKMQVLFGHLDKDRLMDVVNAFYAKDFTAGETIIAQGDPGDSLYIVSSGQVDVFVKRPGVPCEDERGPKVVQLGSGGLFGELALMYNAPRAATVVAVDGVSTFKLDAQDFKMLLAQSGAAAYAQYEGWLKEVEILKVLNNYELTKLADLLESECFDAGEDIVKQGDPGDKFYILEDGQAAAYITGDGGEKLVKEYSKQGEYFGEVGLITEEPRRATVRAMGEGCSVVSVSKEDFIAVLGPLNDLLKAQIDKYPAYAEFLQ